MTGVHRASKRYGCDVATHVVCAAGIVSDANWFFATGLAIQCF
jgi:hypothetical protein